MRLEGNPLECACFNLDFVRWLWQTSVSLDGEGHRANYTCTTETGEMSSTEQVMAHWMEHWRRCVGVRMLAIATSAFLIQVSVINTNTGIMITTTNTNAYMTPLCLLSASTLRRWVG